MKNLQNNLSVKSVRKTEDDSTRQLSSRSKKVQPEKCFWLCGTSIRTKSSVETEEKGEKYGNGNTKGKQKKRSRGRGNEAVPTSKSQITFSFLTLEERFTRTIREREQELNDPQIPINNASNVSNA
ncbi:CLUMA_CG009599, isoform A [Clunio marinus]|uniref:CLUMA_CG009599, isoform A n=1 Tax=Clunio marinus TaxID=568069 RepID=A0A1J1I8X3_9DIPT|nr:CLUMA_CG009599, isoform A [Clunio marinus]